MPKVINKGKLAKEKISTKIKSSTKPVMAKAVEEKPKVTRKRTKKVVTPDVTGAIVIKEVKDRKVLAEGRNNGMAFGFLKLKSRTDVQSIFETVQPLSPCKDYLNEVVITERFGMGTQGCGLRYPEKLNIYEGDVAYMAIKIMKSKSDSYSYSSGVQSTGTGNTVSFEGDIEKLKNNHKNIEKLLNQIEDVLQLKTRTIIHEANDGYFLVVLPVEWCQSTPAISLYTLLMRVSFSYDGKEDYMKYLSRSPHPGDSYLINGALPKLKSILEKKTLPPNIFSTTKAVWDKGTASPHGRGIIGWNGSFDEVNHISEKVGPYGF